MITKIGNYSVSPTNRQSPKPISIKNATYMTSYRNNVSYNNSYALTFLGKKDYTQNEKEYFEYKKQLAKKLHIAMTNRAKADWDFYTNSTNKNRIKAKQAFDKRLQLLSDKNIYEDLKNFDEKGITDPNLKKSLTNLLKDYKENVINAADIKDLKDKENEIAMKVNSYQPQVDGKTYSNVELNNMMKSERNVETRKKIYSALYVDNTQKISPDLVELVKMRNKFAQKNGYDNFFSYKLKETYKIDEKKLFELIDSLHEQTEDIYEVISKKTDEKLSKAYGIKPEELMPWHYGLQLEDNPSKEADKYIKDNETMQKFVFDMYKKMGWDIPKEPIKLDIYPRANKNKLGFCFDIDTNKDVRILANLRNDLDSAGTLIHELGHGIYDTGISGKISYFDREPASSAATEAIAMHMADLPYREGFLQKALGIPKELVKKLTVANQKSKVSFIKRSMLIINFEREMYKNPDQDLAKLWYGMVKKYQKINTPSTLDNTFASIPHFLSHPAYYPNYLMADVMNAQIYESAHAKLGKLTSNKKTAQYFRTKFLRYGSTLEESELIKKFTGKELNANAFSKQFKNLIKHIH